MKKSTVNWYHIYIARLITVFTSYSVGYMPWALFISGLDFKEKRNPLSNWVYEWFNHSHVVYKLSFSPYKRTRKKNVREQHSTLYVTGWLVSVYLDFILPLFVVEHWALDSPQLLVSDGVNNTNDVSFSKFKLDKIT